MAGRFYLKSLGCKVNQCDGDELARLLTDLGLERASDPSGANLCVVNGCTVTSTADAKCMKLVRSLHRANPSAHIAVTGCTAIHLMDGPAVDNAGHATVVCNDTAAWQRIVDELPAPTSEYEGHNGPPADRTRAFVKVQDGCDAFCAYCIVPYMRGMPQSVPRDRIFADVERALARDAKEITLTGTRLGKYGGDMDPPSSLADLIEDVAGRYDVPRIRLSSIELATLTDELLDTFGRVSTVQHHIHIPLQSGDDGVLRAMGRPYCPDEFREGIDRLRNLWPDIGVTTDVIVGFPGETAAAFESTMSFVEEMAFSRLHVFRYSPRPGTPAAEMDGKVHERDVRDRSRSLIELGDRLAAEFAVTHAGRTVEVLVESRRHRETGSPMGFTGNYLTAVVRDAKNDMINSIVTARVVETDGATLVCDVG
jgi:threonylcarbamoyladenosine tRNA methylthiotransferase MtaB